MCLFTQIDIECQRCITRVGIDYNEKLCPNARIQTHKPTCIIDTKKSEIVCDSCTESQQEVDNGLLEGYQAELNKGRKTGKNR